jgi:hypothetical protein
MTMGYNGAYIKMWLVVSKNLRSQWPLVPCSGFLGPEFLNLDANPSLTKVVCEGLTLLN